MGEQNRTDCTGVVPAISSIVQKVTTVGENVAVMTPVYNIFFDSILNNGRNVLESLLKFDGSEYQIDFADLEEKLSNPQTTLLILCNPHNPVGKIWDKETLNRIGDLCSKYHVLVLAAIAPVAAFNYGGEWLDELRKYLWENRRFAEEYIKREIKDVSAVSARATYLLWLDCRKVIGSSTELCRFIRSHSGLYLSDGKEYRNGEGFLRMNLACPREQVEEGLKRLKESVTAYKAWAVKQC